MFAVEATLRWGNATIAGSSFGAIFSTACGRDHGRANQTRAFHRITLAGEVAALGFDDGDLRALGQGAESGARILWLTPGDMPGLMPTSPPARWPGRQDVRRRRMRRRIRFCASRSAHMHRTTPVQRLGCLRASGWSLDEAVRPRRGIASLRRRPRSDGGAQEVRLSTRRLATGYGTRYFV